MNTHNEMPSADPVAEDSRQRSLRMFGGSDILDARASGSRQGGPAFSLRNRMHRAVWGLTWTLCAAWTPPPLHAWRRFVLRRFGAEIGSNVRIYGTVRIWLPSNLVIGRNAAVGPGVILYCMGVIHIGEDAIVSQRSHLCAGTHDADDPLFQLEARPITIGPKAWVASEAFVGPGVTVGEGAILGARGVATRDLPAWEIHAGNPARRIRDRRRF